MECKSWNIRGFVSLALLLQFVVITVSGAVRYVSPRGREAHWVDWRFLGLDKDQWTSIHMVSGLCCVILFLIHLGYNLGPMLNYLCLKGKTVRRYSKELVASVFLTLLLLGMTVADFSPVNMLFVQSERLKDAYADSIERAPWAHAEEAGVDTVCKRLGISVEQALVALNDKSCPAMNSTETLAEISKRQGVSPMELYRILRALAPNNGPLHSKNEGDDKPRCGAYKRHTP